MYRCNKRPSRSAFDEDAARNAASDLAIAAFYHTRIMGHKWVSGRALETGGGGVGNRNSNCAVSAFQ